MVGAVNPERGASPRPTALPATSTRCWRCGATLAAISLRSVANIARASCYRTVPFLGPIRVAVLIARVQTPHRFRTKRQFWAYCGLALETRSSADYRFVNGQLERKKKPAFIRGLNLNHNHDLKNLFKSAATSASGSNGPFAVFYENLLSKGVQAGPCAPDAGAQDRRHRLACLEERRSVRRRVRKATSRVNAPLRRLYRSYVRHSRLLLRLGFEGKYPGRVRLRAPRCASLTGHRMLPRTTQQSHSAAPRRESPIEPWLALRPPLGLCSFSTERRRSVDVKTTSEPRIYATRQPQGLDVRELPLFPAKGEVFSLDIPFYRTRRSWTRQPA